MAVPDPPSPPEKIVVCPACGGASLYSMRNRFRPFCSERCKNLDLGAWASERFRVADEALPSDQIDAGPKEQR